MKATEPAAANIDEYIAKFSPEIQAILERTRKTVQAAVPAATEVISYRMPAFKLGGVLLYFAAFKNHIGVYPPVSGDAGLVKRLAPYRGEKGNLRFPYDQPMRYDLIEEIARLREKQLREKQLRAKPPKTRKKRP